jgi:hypothetical protein
LWLMIQMKKAARVRVNSVHVCTEFFDEDLGGLEPSLDGGGEQSCGSLVVSKLGVGPNFA